jgi:hypothetical protein
VLTAGLAAGFLGACTSQEDAPAAPATQTDPDEAVVVDAWVAETAILALLDEVTSGRPRRARALAGTRAVHAAHVGLLSRLHPEAASETAPATTPAPAAFSGDDRAAYLLVARAEDQLGRTLRQSGLDSASGPLARVLASMAAATAQQSATVRTLA